MLRRVARGGQHAEAVRAELDLLPVTQRLEGVAQPSIHAGADRGAGLGTQVPSTGDEVVVHMRLQGPSRRRPAASTASR